jgi:hypothetical protein
VNESDPTPSICGACCPTLGQNPDPGESPETMRDLGRWQPDWVFVSSQHKRIALVDLCRSADGLPNQVTTAGTWKQYKNSPLLKALIYYSDNGWVAHIFPWVVGMRDLIDTQETLAGRQQRTMCWPIKFHAQISLWWLPWWVHS